MSALPRPSAARTGREFFEQLYRSTPDPWGFAEDGYELDRYRTILREIPIGRYGTALEPGCSIGVLTRALADRCDRVVAFDIAGPAVDAARRRCADRPAVEISRGALPCDLPAERVDLIVLSEVGYYLDRKTLEGLARRLGALLRPGGRLVAAHWTGTSSDHVLHGREVHRILATHLDLVHRRGAEHGRPARPDLDHPDPGHADASGDRRGFVLDVWDA